jgi:hypothetical protein
VRRRQQSGQTHSTDDDPSRRVVVIIRQPRSASVPAVRTFGAGEAQVEQALSRIALGPSLLERA